jgi:transposase, IS5 family
MKQLSLATAGFERYGKTTRRAVFLAEMERVVPWAALRGLIEPVYPKPGNGRPPVGVERMLRVYFLQQWFNLSAPAVEEALYDSEAMRRLSGSISAASRRPMSEVDPERATAGAAF